MRKAPASLYPRRKKESVGDLFQQFIATYGGILIVLAVIFGLLLFVGIAFAVVPPTESGVYYNHL